MRLAFMGTPDFAVTALDALVEAGHDIAAVYTQPPRPANRGRLTPTPVHQRAEALGLPVRTPLSLKPDAEKAAFAELDLDAAVVAAYGLLLPRAILESPRHGCLNIHASLLPRWRGAAPIQRAILAGDHETGVTIMQMERGLDTGPMLAKASIAITDETAGELTERLAVIGARLMLDVLARLPDVQAETQPDDGVTYAHKIDKAEARIDWDAPAEHICRLVRAMQPSPGAWFNAQGQRVKLLSATLAEGAGEPGTVLGEGVIATGRGAVRLVTVQPGGKGAMPAADWWRGRRLAVGDRL
ncbi:methionyl-tRNA formyltransferase [Sandaracinobacteroides sp. A072]|uniref:methionyl-tRNA formyltransferase n=1 Tax=Sandaracinobacteroides sp. A072 TaxID=3461146 RepID=UPI004041EF4D